MAYLVWLEWENGTRSNWYVIVGVLGHYDHVWSQCKALWGFDGADDKLQQGQFVFVVIFWLRSTSIIAKLMSTITPTINIVISSIVVVIINSVRMGHPSSDIGAVENIFGR